MNTESGAVPDAGAPHNEIRFTRSRQAVVFFGLSLLAFCVAAALFLLSTGGWTRSQEPPLKGRWYGLAPLPAVVFFFWWGMHLARHAYIIFTPLGIELFPFFFPGRNLQVIYWSEIVSLRVGPGNRCLEIHLQPPDGTGDRENEAGQREIHVALAPLSRHARSLLDRTIEGVSRRRGTST